MCVRTRVVDDEWTFCAVCRRPFRRVDQDDRGNRGDDTPTHASCPDARTAIATAETREPITA
jgi:hypothetical protein